MSLRAFRSAGASHVGCRRTRNEDAWLIQSEDGPWAVADGMGGLQAGDVAAEAIVAGLAGAADDPGASLGRRADAVERVLHGVHRLLLEEEGRRGAPVGSTVVACVAAADRLVCLWAGDSRCYLWRRGRLMAVSRDHSHVQDLVDRGLISTADAKDHPKSHIVTRAVGIGSALAVERRSADLQTGDRILLCSDGLTQMVEDEEIAATITAGATPQAVCDDLVRRALDRGGYDNVTVVLAERRAA